MQPTDRLHALDAVRAFALICGVVLHATMAYLPGLPPFIVSPTDEPAKSPALALVFFVIHVFRMTTFFVIAGFFARQMLHAKGLGGFLKNRLLRITVPLVVGWPVMIAAMAGLWILGLALAYHGVAPSKPAAAAAAAPQALAFPWTHLWFLYMLMLLYASSLVLRGLVVVIDRRGRLREALAGLFAGLVRSGLGVFVLALPVAAALYLTPDWHMWFGIPTPDSALIPQPASALAFFMAFAVGWTLQRRADLLTTLGRLWPLNLVLAAALVAGSLAVAGALPTLDSAPDGAPKLIYAALYAAAVWSSAFAVIGLAVRLLSNPSRPIRYMADASYWIYLAHLPLVYALQIAVMGLDWPAGVKFAMVLGVALTLLLLSYQLLVRYSFIGAVLNGRRRREPQARHGTIAQPA